MRGLRALSISAGASKKSAKGIEAISRKLKGRREISTRRDLQRRRHAIVVCSGKPAERLKEKGGAIGEGPRASAVNRAGIL